MSREVQSASKVTRHLQATPHRRGGGGAESSIRILTYDWLPIGPPASTLILFLNSEPKPLDTLGGSGSEADFGYAISPQRNGRDSFSVHNWPPPDSHPKHACGAPAGP